ARALLSSDADIDAEIVGAALPVALEHIAYRMFTPWSLPDWLPTPRNRRFRAAVATLRRIVSGVITARRRSTESRLDLLDMLMAARDDDGRGMSDVELRD